ncbi:FadR/GntR family transcriptional regulator [Micromonospora sp. HM5-17]|jgi:DNA-binding FadR family transcriptional regulator|uniref:FadR/GntR family transcriptional regulator n=1 Tax=Micromonospora sp. HM5-17 TaxID=2487710 RepID=UPI000F46E9A5|nr:FadR/GntR family transcriptional regulator [Micromonospora sp. HM5-17]ROT26329.1 FadR family transcriptional regulator [Micromonospora sp. HM5-17]
MRTRTGATLQERIVDLIHERRLAPGAAMPTEPQLMDLLGASRNSVREAVRALQALGIVEIRHGYGTFVGHAPLDVLSPSLTFRVRSRADRGVRALQDLVEVRELLEVGLIGEVAKTVSEPRLAALDALVTAMERDREADRAFHSLLYESCGNELVLQLIGLFWDVYHEVGAALDPPEGRAADIVANHRRIVEALRARDSRGAQEAMRLHFHDVKARIARADAATDPPAAD